VATRDPAVIASRWSGPDGEPVDAPEPPPEGSFYGPIGDWQAGDYERNAFTRGTAQEVEFLHTALRLRPGAVVIDVGCATGRHARALSRRGARVVGIDISAGLLRAAAAQHPGPWVQADARRLPARTAAADAVMSVCQGGFGITPGGDEQVLAEMARVLRPGGRLVLTAFSLAFAARWLVAGDAFDVERGLLHSAADVRGPGGASRRFDLWTQCYGAGHLRLLAEDAGLVVEGVFGVEPGAYGRRPPTLRDPELLLLAHRPAG
jgi:SAM-dependent methyltransferase